MSKTLAFLFIMLLVPSVCFGGIDLNGDADTVNIPDINASADFSFSAWVIFDAQDRDYGIVENAHQNEFAIWLDNDTIDAIDAYTNNGSFRVISGNRSFSINTWYHVVLTCDNSANITKLYVDGTQSGPTSNFGATNQAGSTINIGRKATNEMDGKVTEVSIWTSVLTENEILLLASSRTKRIPLQIQKTNLHSYQPLDDYIDGSVLNTDSDGYKDLSGNNNHAQGVDANSNSLNSAEEVLTYP